MQDKHEFRIVITPFCNYRCFFCHSEGFTEKFTSLLLSPQDYRFIAKAGKELWGWDSVTITGGGPLISPIYQETCSEIAKEGIRITTVTNATLISSPRKILANNDQINVSIHTMNPDIYKKITNSSYPLDQVLDTIISIRSYFPDMKIHLNSTIVRGMNDSPEDIERLVQFADMINGEAKFIDLASKNQSIVVPFEEIEARVESIGFRKIDSGIWQTIFQRENSIIKLTRCGFSENHIGRGHRNLFLNPDGSILADGRENLKVKLLREIHERNIEAFAKKVEWYFPPAKRI